MERILEVFKNYFGIAFMLLIVSYLAPKETYRKYFQFVISILLTIILFQPLEEWIFSGERARKIIDFHQLEEAFEFQEYYMKLEGDIFECFGLEETSEQE